ncbi:MAG: GNAT family N-acetyltransferase [Ketobacter sp.]|nr:MAG: GNAT family N-acetyltransferase [Ketobacter sp.]
MQRLNAWWGGRAMTDMLPRLFFTYFHHSSFVCLDGTRIVGFLVGFLPESSPDTGYVHFVGVDPDYRRSTIARSMYEHFFRHCRQRGVSRVKCVTSPTNLTSIAFHQRLGFRASAYDGEGQPIAALDYDGPGQHRVLFTRALEAQD